ncbi:vanadium-dependent haloperoxidase [Peteryoungia desertarenae]|uniref:Vanadium-dependent haloperoxidase n=1 Tax=Peteryoungia desertarenae TaxID=1813451 RepID=A0ABX6QKJ1_9HYPH|nr:vanadium-dependent haloperoxidase [Peteryoungia desertarenae]QLF69098.1 vanadium-dependent haloperoxidase [Peteryoungia desertarenae]
MKAVARRLPAMWLVIFSLLAMPAAASERLTTAMVIDDWYKLVLNLVRHTPTYSPPVASRAFAYLGITAYEANASGNPALKSLAGQLNGLTPLPSRNPAVTYDDVVVLNAALASAAGYFFDNTGPTGQRTMKRVTERMAARVSEGVDPQVLAASEAHGRAIFEHVRAWADQDGGAKVQNMGFPLDYAVSTEPGRWVPTSTIGQQQTPLLPQWASNRTFAMPKPETCNLPPPPEYSEAEGSEFRKEAEEVYLAVKNLTPEQEIIARFWSDDPMLSPTPPGHWIAIALDALDMVDADGAKSADLLARLGVGLADAFIGCWYSKFDFDLIRPVTYIRKVMDPTWEPILITPPFPEYPSGHSTQSGAAATVLTAFFGENFAFIDDTHVDDGLAARSFPSFWAAAEEAGISRLYGGIHFRAAIDRGLDQGRCIGEYTVQLVTAQ